MKVVQTKPATTTAKKNTPFFNTETGQGFFSPESNHDAAFFKPQNTNAPIQAKLNVGAPDDHYEHEADAVADKVVQRLSDPVSIQRKPATPVSRITPLIQNKSANTDRDEKLQKKEDDEDLGSVKEKIQRKPIFESNAEPPDDEKNIQRKCSECKKEDELQKKEMEDDKSHLHGSLQMKAIFESNELLPPGIQKKSDPSSSSTSSPKIESSLSASKGSGSPLPSTVRQQMESSFGADFSKVKIHDNSSAMQMSKDLHAQAFTHGSDIYFNSGKYDTNSSGGQHLLAHELTHTIQQGASNGLVQRNETPDDTVLPARFLIEDIVSATDKEFVYPTTATAEEKLQISQLNQKYKEYTSKLDNPSGVRNWAFAVTTGQPRSILENLLGENYAKGSKSGEPVLILLSSFPKPADYSSETLKENLKLLQENQQLLFDRLENFLDKDTQNGQVNQGYINILKGNIGQILSADIQNQKLNEIRKSSPNAELFNDIKLAFVRDDGSVSGKVSFTDGIIASTEGKNEKINLRFEVKTGSTGGAEATDQIHKWIEGHLNQDIILYLKNKNTEKAIRYLHDKNNNRGIVGLSTAPYVLIAPKGTEHLGLGSANQSAAGIERYALAYSPEQLNYITRIVLESIQKYKQTNLNGTSYADALSLGEGIHNSILSDSQIKEAIKKGLDQLPPNKTPELTSTDELLNNDDPAKLQQKLNEGNGLVIIGGKLVRVSVDADQIHTEIITPQPIQFRLVPTSQTSAAQNAAGPNAAAPKQLSSGKPETNEPYVIYIPIESEEIANTPNFINFLPANPIQIGNRIIPPSVDKSEAKVEVGEIIAIGGELEWEITDTTTGLPIAGTMVGGRLVQLVKPGGQKLVIDTETREIVSEETITIGGRTFGIREFEETERAMKSERNEEKKSAGSFGGRGGGAVAGGLAVILIVNEILGPLGEELEGQRSIIKHHEAEINFWFQFNADPKIGIWDLHGKKLLDPKTNVPRTAVFASPYYPFVIDIDIEKFKKNLSASISDFQDFVLFLNSALPGLGTLGVIVKLDAEGNSMTINEKEAYDKPGKYYAVVNKFDNTKYYDITDTIEEIRTKMVSKDDKQNKEKVKKLSAEEKGKIYRLKKGSNTPLYRSARGNQPIRSDTIFLGPDPWVRFTDTKNSGGIFGDDRVLVMPANGDASRASKVTAYEINISIEKAKQEAEDGGRRVSESVDKSTDRLNGFVAEPDKDMRFGYTRYYRHPNFPNSSTVAIGELKKFWVNVDDTEKVPESEIDKYTQDVPDAAPNKDEQQVKNPSVPDTTKKDGPDVQLKCAACENEEAIQRREIAENGNMVNNEKIIYRKCAECDKKEKELQKKSLSSPAATNTNNIESSLSASKGTGSPLPHHTRQQMESSFDADFSNVRVHDNSAAIQMSKDLNAQAFTHGSDIYFSPGKYDTNSNSGKHLLAHELTHVVQQQSASKNIQRQPDVPPAVTSAKFIVDNTIAPANGQMRKTDFLNRLKEEICVTVNQAMVGTAFSSDNCPYIQAAFKRHENSSPLQLEKLIERYEPAAARAKNIDEVIQLMKLRVYEAAKHWVQTGGDLSSILKIFGGMAMGAGSALKDDSQNNTGLFFKANPTGPQVTQSPQSVMQNLGKGHGMDAGTTGKMESAFGTGFSNVELHTDDHAAKLSRDMNARAFTVGNHIAFANGEHKPGTLVGDALMAHELAHVQQQRDAGKINNGHSLNDLEKDADHSAEKIVSSEILGEKDLQVQPKLKTGLSLQRCGSSAPEYESLDPDRRQAVEKYLYDDLLQTQNEADQIPEPITLTWAGDPFLITLSHPRLEVGKGDQFVLKVDFKGKHNPLTPQSIMESSKEYRIPLLRTGILSVFVETIDANTINVWPYGKAPQNERFEFKHEGPKFYDLKDSRGRIHYFTFRNATGSSGYSSDSMYIADKDAKAGDYPEAPTSFYPDTTKEGLGADPVINIAKGSEARIDADADYYKELDLKWTHELIGDEYKYSVQAYYIPSDPQGAQPRSFTFTAKKDLIEVDFWEAIVNASDGGSDTIIGLGSTTPKLLWHIPVPKINGDQIIYSWNLNNGQAGQFSFPLQSGYHAPESQFELPENSSKATELLWSQDAKFGPLRDLFKISMGVNDVKSKEAFFNIRSVGAEISGQGNIKIPIYSVDASNPFSPTVLNHDGQGLDIAIDAMKTIQVHIFDHVTQVDSMIGSTANRKHKLRVKGNTLLEDYFFDFEIEDQYYKTGGGLAYSASGSQAANNEENFSFDARTLSIDTLAEKKTFIGRIEENQRELIFVRKKAFDAGLLAKDVYLAWSDLDGNILLYRTSPEAPIKKDLLTALDTYATTYKKIDLKKVLALKTAIETGKMELIMKNYFDLLNPMDEEIAESFSKSTDPVIKDLGLKTSYLLNIVGNMNEIRQFEPLRIPATFAIKELYEQNKPQYGHTLELYAYKDGKRLHLKNFTNRKEIKHIETGIPSGEENKSIADLLAETKLIDKLNDPDLFPAGLLNYRIPGQPNATLVTKGGMSATSYAKLIGGGIAIAGLVLLAIASLGTLTPEAAAGIAGVGGWMMLIGDATVLTAATVDIIADRYQTGHFDSKRVLMNVFDIATSLLSAGTLTLGKVAVKGAILARTGEEISGLQKFAGKWYTTVRLAQGAGGAMGVILMTDDAIKKIKAISNMKPGAEQNEAIISLFWHLLSITAVTVLGLAGSNQFVPSKNDLLILRYAKASNTMVPVAYLSGIARFTQTHLGEFTDESAALRFIENNLTPEAKAWFNARNPTATTTQRLNMLQGIEAAWEPHGLDLNGALTASGAKAAFRAAGITTIPTDELLAQRYSKLGHDAFLNWNNSILNMAAAAVNEADRTFLLNMLEMTGFNYERALGAAEIGALQAVQQRLREAYLVGTTGDLEGKITALAPEFTTLEGTFGKSFVDRFKIRLSNFFIQDKVIYGRQKEIPTVAGAAPTGDEREVVGGHSAKILSDPRYEFVDNANNVITDPAKNIAPNTDGTYTVKFRKNIGFTNPDVTKPNFQGRKNKGKPSTLAPMSWTDGDILNAGENVAQFGVTDASSGQTFKYGNYKGVNWAVVLEDGALTASYPVGPTPPAGVPKIPKVP